MKMPCYQWKLAMVVAKHTTRMKEMSSFLVRFNVKGMSLFHQHIYKMLEGDSVVSIYIKFCNEKTRRFSYINIFF